MNATRVLGRHITQVLGQDPDIITRVGSRLYEFDAVPDNAAIPYITWSAVSPGRMVSVVGDEVIWADVLVDVAAWMIGNDLGVIAPISGRIYTKLHRSSGVVAGLGEVLWCSAEMEILPPGQQSQTTGRFMRQGGYEFRGRVKVTGLTA